jgi:hypothetical protein
LGMLQLYWFGFGIVPKILEILNDGKKSGWDVSCSIISVWSLGNRHRPSTYWKASAVKKCFDTGLSTMDKHERCQGEEP